MRMMHISDLHLGRELLGVSRQAEQLALVLELIALSAAEDVDVTVIAGDVFDTSNPPAWAEDAFYDLLDGLSDGGRRAVVAIAGNHDNAVRLAAAEPLARRTGIWLVGDAEATPGPSALEGRVSIEPLGPGAAVIRSADGARAVAIAALPFVSEARIARRPTATVPDESDDRDAYALALGELFADRAARLPLALPRVVVGHLWVKGGAPSQSERVTRMDATGRVGGLSDMPASLLPAVDYVALGHLHRPQSVSGGACPIIYPGSPIAYSVSEAGQVKRAVLVTLVPGQPAAITEAPLRSGRPLEVWTARSIEEVRERAQGRTDAPIVALRLELDAPISRSELDQLDALGVTFVDLLVTSSTTRDEPGDGTTLDDDLPDDALIRAYVASQLSTVDPVLVDELYRLLQGEELELEAVTP